MFGVMLLKIRLEVERGEWFKPCLRRKKGVNSEYKVGEQ